MTSSPLPPIESPRGSWAFVVACLVIGALASVIRIIAAFDQPWLDEIWSLTWARKAHSALQIVTDHELNVDNNHWLNSLVLYAIGPRTQWIWYRLPALASGIGLLAVCAGIARRWGRAAVLLALALMGLSFMFVVYASEARGYGPVVFFGGVAFVALRRFIEGRHRLAAAVLFAATCVLGFLSHASFVYAFGGCLAYAPIALARRRPLRRVALAFAAVFAVPSLFFGWLYLTAIAHIAIAGSTRGTHLDGMLSDLLAYVFGAPADAAAVTWVGLAIVVAGVGHGCWVLVRRRCDDWIFLLTAGVIAPVLLIAIRQPDPLFARYVFAAMPFVMLLLAAAGGDLLRRGILLRAVAVICVAAFVVGNVAHLWPFLRLGRGHNLEAVAFLVDQTPGPTITYDAADRPTTDLLMAYYVPRVALQGKTLDYRSPDGPLAADWFVINRFYPDPLPPTVYPRTRAEPYHLMAVFPHAGISGCDWFLYRRQGAATQPADAGR